MPCGVAKKKVNATFILLSLVNASPLPVPSHVLYLLQMSQIIEIMFIVLFFFGVLQYYLRRSYLGSFSSHLKHRCCIRVT